MNMNSVKITLIEESKLPFVESFILTNIYHRISKTYTQKIRNLHAYKDEVMSLNSVVDSLSNTLPKLPQYEAFLQSIHDILITTDTNFRAILLRVIRICLNGGIEYVEAFLKDTDLIWAVCTSFEKDSEYLPERIQAHKIMKSVATTLPIKFPAAFARSLVAVASQKDDQLRRISIEALRILCVHNPFCFASANGATVLFEAVLDPNLSDMSEALLLSILQALSDDQSRKYLCPRSDIRTLLSPLTDLDFENNPDRHALWQTAKTAFITLMRSWPGIVLLSSDELGLAVVVKLLQDPKTSVSVQNIIVEAFIELFKPLVSRVSKPRRNYNPSDFYGALSNSSKSTETRERGTSNISDIPRAMSTTLLSSYFRRSSADNNSGGNLESLAKPRVSFTADDIDIKNRSLSIDSKPLYGNGNSSISSTINNTNGTKKGFLTSLFSSARAASKTKGKTSTNQISNQLSSSSAHSFVDLDRESYGDLRPSDMRSTVIQDNGSDDNSPDPVFNLMDNYCAILCCSVIHAKLIEGLCFLATHAELSLATRSRDLLVDILRTIATIFPEANCSDLLAMPFLIEFASTVSTNKWSSRAEKASHVLFAMTEAFSVTSMDQFRMSHYKSRVSIQNNAQNTFLDESLPNNISSMVRFGDSSRNLIQRQTSSVRSASGNGTSNNKNSTGFQSTRSVNSNSSSSSTSVSSLTIFDLSEEVKQTSQSRVFSLIESSSNHLRSKSKVMVDLRMTLISTVDKNDFNKQMENSRILGKEGKEPLKWDWSLINDMLEFSFQHSDRLGEALKTKWVRRLSGFYRCTNDEKAFFANMDWDVNNLHYLESACNLYHVLVEDEQGMSFLSSDRRGLLFNDISREMEQLIESVSRNTTQLGMFKNVFRPYSCAYTMAREYFTLLGRLTTTPHGRKVLDENKVFHHMSFLANYQSLDYISRLSVTSLAFTDNGFLSKHFLQLWACSSSCNPDLKGYMYNLLLVLLLSRPQDFFDWGVDVLASYLSNEDSPNSILYKILLIACEEKSLLRQLIARKINISDEAISKPILTRFACVSEGIEYMRNLGQLDREMDHWKSVGLKEYTIQVERLTARAFWHVDGKGNYGSNTLIESVYAIPIIVTAYAAFSMLQQPLSPFVMTEEKISSRKNSVNGHQTINGVSSGIGHIMSPSMSSQQQQSLQQSLDCNSAALDLEGLIRTPWNIEAKLSTILNSQANIDFIKLDTFLDISDLHQPIGSEVVSDDNRVVKVRGIVVDSKGYAIAQPVATNRTISSTLMIGINPVHRDGMVMPITEARAQKRKSITTIVNTTSNVSGRDSNGRRSTVSSPVPDDGDIPATSMMENLFDWTVCKPSHRQGSNVVDLGDGLFSVEIPNEPVKFIFSKVAPNTANTTMTSTINAQRRKSDIGFGRNSVSDNSLTLFNPNGNRYSGGFIYLKEIHYYLRLETRQSLYVPMPRHFYGELSRSSEGLTILKNYHVIGSLLTISRRESNSIIDRSSALWGLGHIGCTDAGFATIMYVDSSFVEWIIENVVDCPNLSLRGTFFAVMGLLGRSKKGARKLFQLRWSTTPSGSSAAVAIPRDLRVLFCGEVLNTELESFDANGIISAPPVCAKSLSPFLADGAVSLGEEVLNLIAKLPGIVPIFKESKNRLEYIKSHHPEIFKNRQVYLAVQQLFSSYSFKLSVRREIVKLFDMDAKIKIKMQE